MAELENIIGGIMSSPESMGKIMEIAKLFGGEEKKEEKTPESPPLSLGDVSGAIDPEMISKVMGLLNDYNASDDRRIRLLGAIRPYLRDSDSFHVDRAIHIVKLSHVAKNALKNFLK